MVDHYFIRQGLLQQHFPVYENEIPYIYNILVTVNQAKEALRFFPYLNEEVPITIVDKDMMRCPS